jgi:hypothetical protein
MFVVKDQLHVVTAKALLGAKAAPKVAAAAQVVMRFLAALTNEDMK